MQLERLALRLRPRSAWEALDAGFALARAHYLPLWLLAFTHLLPLALLLHAISWWSGARHSDDRAWTLAFVALWWLKPLVERSLLGWLGQAVFGVRTPLLAWLRGGPSRRDASGWLRALSIARLAPNRSYMMPVRVLEQLRGAPAAARIRQLGAAHGGAALMLTVVLSHLEFVFYITLVALAALLIPDGTPLPQRLGELASQYVQSTELDPLMLPFSAASDALVMSLIMPFYVAAGFALYLQRRTELEGWDVELGLRQIEQRVRSRRARTPLVLVLAVLSLALAGQPTPARAQDASPQARARELAADPVFGPMRQEQTLEWDWPTLLPARETDMDWLARLGPWLADLGNLGASGGRALLWGVLGVLLAVLAWRVLPHLGWLRRTSRTARPGIRAETERRPAGPEIPLDPAAAVAELLAAGRVRAALSLLLRASLASLGAPVSATEAELEAGALPAAQQAALAALLRDWSALAYGGHSLPADAAQAHLQALRPLLGKTAA